MVTNGNNGDKWWQREDIKSLVKQNQKPFRFQPEGVKSNEGVLNPPLKPPFKPRLKPLFKPPLLNPLKPLSL